MNKSQSRVYFPQCKPVVVSKYGFKTEDLQSAIGFYYQVKSLCTLDVLVESGALVFISDTLPGFYDDVCDECPVPITMEEFIEQVEEKMVCFDDSFLAHYVILSNGVWFINN